MHLQISFSVETTIIIVCNTVYEKSVPFQSIENETCYWQVVTLYMIYNTIHPIVSQPPNLTISPEKWNRPVQKTVLSDPYGAYVLPRGINNKVTVKWVLVQLCNKSGDIGTISVSGQTNAWQSDVRKIGIQRLPK